MALTGHRAWARTSAGSIIAGAAVEVRRVADNSLATLYTDAGGGTGVSNPFTTEADGSYEFYTEPDRYNVLVGTGASQETVPLDLTDGRAQVPWPSRAQAVTDIANGFEAADGTIASDGTVQYVASAGATAISDMLGWLPFGAPSEAHFNNESDYTSFLSTLSKFYTENQASEFAFESYSSFGGSWDAKQLSYTDDDAGGVSGSRVNFASIRKTLGSGLNGPSNADYAGFFESTKDDHLNSTVGGEVDAVYMVVRQGQEHDAGGALIDARKVSGGTGGLVGIEILTAFVDSVTGSVNRHVQTITGFMEGAGGFTGSKGSGFVAEPRVGDIHSGFAAIGRSDLTATFDWAFYAATSRAPTDQIFAVDGETGTVHIGAVSTEYTLRNTSGAFAVHNTAGAKMFGATSSGVAECTDGIELSSDSNHLRKAFTASVGLDFPSIAAQSNQQLTATITGAAPGDFVCVSPTNDLFSSNLVFTGRVTSANTVTVACQNISASAIDPTTQNLRILVIRFG